MMFHVNDRKVGIVTGLKFLSYWIRVAHVYLLRQVKVHDA